MWLHFYMYTLLYIFGYLYCIWAYIEYGMCVIVFCLLIIGRIALQQRLLDHDAIKSRRRGIIEGVRDQVQHGSIVNWAWTMENKQRKYISDEIYLVNEINAIISISTTYNSILYCSPIGFYNIPNNVGWT